MFRSLRYQLSGHLPDKSEQFTHNSLPSFGNRSDVTESPPCLRKREAMPSSEPCGSNRQTQPAFDVDAATLFYVRGKRDLDRHDIVRPGGIQHREIVRCQIRSGTCRGHAAGRGVRPTAARRTRCSGRRRSGCRCAGRCGSRQRTCRRRPGTTTWSLRGGRTSLLSSVAGRLAGRASVIEPTPEAAPHRLPCRPVAAAARR